MRGRLVLLVALAALAAPSAASACSYAIEPGTTRAELDDGALRGSDGAFIGTVVAVVPPGEAGAFYIFRVERVVKGRFSLRYVVVQSSVDSCGLYVRPGSRTGLTVDRRRGGWWADDIDRIAPRALIRAARRARARTAAG